MINTADWMYSLRAVPIKYHHRQVLSIPLSPVIPYRKYMIHQNGARHQFILLIYMNGLFMLVYLRVLYNTEVRKHRFPS